MWNMPSLIGLNKASGTVSMLVDHSWYMDKMKLLKYMSTTITNPAVTHEYCIGSSSFKRRVGYMRLIYKSA